jgi:hypothetical protein
MRTTLLLSIFPSLCVAAYACGATWYVDASVASSGDGLTWETAFKTLQEGIDAASHGDSVVAAEGLYKESIKFLGKNITLTSTHPLSSQVVADTIIEGIGALAVRFDGTEDETCLLSGFTISGRGTGISGSGWDGNTRATIQNNVITRNYSDVGAGVAGCDGAIRNNLISRNHANFAGAGLAYCNGLMENNIIADNCVGNWCPRGSSPARSPTLTQEYPDIYKGAGLYQCNGIIRNNIIAGNRATEYDWGVGWAVGCGGGLAECNGLIEGNVIWGNVAEKGQGGGLYNCDAVVRNCVIWGNTASDGDQLWGSKAATYSCIEAWHGGGEGNINLEPRFVDAENGDFRLLPDSPCRNAGNTVAVLEVALSLADNGALISWSGGNDLDGNPRISGAAVDMGAYEYQEGPPSLGFVLEYSSDMTFWESIDVGSVWQWLDEMSDGLGRRFYRIGVR